MNRVSLCMIVRDEAEMLPGCLASVAGAVDEIIIVDTGSTDNTVALAEAAGATVAHRTWDDDFSAPRNRALALAAGDWVLILDADERLAPGAAEVLRAAIRRDDFDCGMLPLHNAVALDADPRAVVSGEARIAEVAYLPRLLRRTDDLQYTGIVHENVDEWLSRGRRVAMVSGADIVHLGGVPSLRERRNKAKRNITLLERYVAEAPDDITPYGYLAHEHHEAGDREAALAVSRAGWQRVEAGHSASDLSILRLATAHAWLELGAGDPAVAVTVCERALAGMPQHPDLYFLRGCAHEAAALRATQRDMRRTHFTAALDDYERAVGRDGHPVLQKFVDGCTTWAGETRRATALLLLGDLPRATAAFDRALELGRRSEARWGKAECLIGVGKAREAKLLLDCDQDKPDGWVLLALAAEAEGDLKAMMVAVSKAQERLPAGFVAPHRRERYVDALSLASMYAGQPAPNPGPMGQVAALMAGHFEATPGARVRDVDRGALSRILQHVHAHGSATHGANLASDRAHVLCPDLQEGATP